MTKLKNYNKFPSTRRAWKGEELTLSSQAILPLQGRGIKGEGSICPHVVRDYSFFVSLFFYCCNEFDCFI